MPCTAMRWLSERSSAARRGSAAAPRAMALTPTSSTRLSASPRYRRLGTAAKARASDAVPEPPIWLSLSSSSASVGKAGPPPGARASSPLASSSQPALPKRFDARLRETRWPRVAPLAMTRARRPRSRHVSRRQPPSIWAGGRTALARGGSREVRLLAGGG